MSRSEERTEKFNQMARDRNRELRLLPYSQLAEMADQESEAVLLDGRKGTLSLVVEKSEDGKLKIIVQGFLDTSLPGLKHVALEGFYKNPNGSIEEMQDGEFYGYD